MPIDPLELPAGGAFLQEGALAAWVAHDTSLVHLQQPTRPACGFVLLQLTADGWRSWRLAENTMRGARTAAAAVVRKTQEPMVLGQVTAATRGGQAFVVDAVARYEPVTSQQLLHRALAAADDVVTLIKAKDGGGDVDPFNARTFDRFVDDLGDDLGGKSDAEVRRAAQQVVKAENIDWANATEEDYKRFGVKLAVALGVAAGVVWKAIDSSLLSAANTMAALSAQAFAKNHKLGVGWTLTRQDKAAVARAASANHFYVRDAYSGPVSAALSAQARRVAAAGIERGYGSEVIAEQLYRRMGREAVGLNRRYMNVVASAINARARVFSSLLMMRRAGVVRYKISAVLDSNTTETCRWLDGKVFSVADGWRQHQRMDSLDSPEDINFVAPWTRERLIKSGPNKGKKGIFLKQRDGDYMEVAVVHQRAFGRVDEVGQYSSGLSNKELTSRGLSFPPYHAHCRTTLTPV